MQEQRRGLDVPEGLPHGMHLGRIKDLDRAIARYGAPFVERMCEHALLGDDVAYAAFKDFKDREKNASWRTFEQGLEHGTDALDDPSPAMAALFADLDRIPDWVDFDQLHRGSIAFWRAGPLVPMVLSWATIGAGFSMYSSTRPVLFSGRLKDPAATGPRLEESFRYVVSAHKPGGMDRLAPGFRLTAKVRMIHCAVRHTLSTSEHWDWPAWGIPINNLDSMNTQAGQFGWMFVGTLQQCGVRFSDQEIEDIIALGRYVGYVIGVPEEILHTDSQDALKKHTFHKSIEQPPDQACRDVINSIIAYTAESPPGDYEVLPGPLAKVMTVERRKSLAYGFLCDWLPEPLIDELQFERTAWRHLPKAVRVGVSAYEAVARRLPHDDEGVSRRSIAGLEQAIAMAETARDVELANPDTLSADVAANKGAVKKAEFATTGGR